MVLHLFSLLASPHLDPEDRLPILLSLGYCTEASGATALFFFFFLLKIYIPIYIITMISCIMHILRAQCSFFKDHNTLSMHFTIALCLFGSTEKHQSQLIWCGGLPIIITLLTEDSSEEVRRAAKFILQTCKKASKSKQFYFPIILYSYVFSHVTVTLIFLFSF